MSMDDDLSVRIQKRAYLLWEQENRPEGRHLEHWCQAEAEIGAEQSRPGEQTDAASFNLSDPAASTMMAAAQPEAAAQPMSDQS
jgi:hypothetical protein